jgi:hypothetical protein
MGNIRMGRWGGLAIGAIAGVLGSGAIALATPVAAEERPRLVPAFFEESRRQGDVGFGESFINDALNGVADPLGGRGSVGVAGTGRSASTDPSAPRGRSGAAPSPPAPGPGTPTPPSNPGTPSPGPGPGLPPGFDRTSVIIRR